MALPAVAAANGRDDSRRLRAAVTTDGILQHERKLQAIANANNGNRAAGTVGYEGSVAYVKDRLRRAGYYVQTSPFDFPTWEEKALPVVQQISPNAKTYVAGDADDSDNEAVDVITFEFSGSGTVEGQVIPTNDVVIPSPAPNTSTSGCEPRTSRPMCRGKSRSSSVAPARSCRRSRTPKAAGAAAVILFNEGQQGRTAPQFQAAPPYIGIPVLFAHFRVGEELFNAASPPVVRITTDAVTSPRFQYNVIAESRRGNPDRAVLLGAHLDSVEACPGINDNGSGTATVLEIAEELAEMGTPVRNQVRFAFWGADEAGLVGSTEYVEQLTAEERAQIMLNLNFDMVGSPNYMRFVYDEDTSSTPPPPGSGEIERVFNDYFRSQDLPAEPTAFDGRSDYGPFIAQGIPAGGLFTGAEGEKTPAQAQVFGGVAGEQYDPCYHEDCDTLNSLVNFPPGLPSLQGNGVKALDEMSDAAAHATWHFARTRKPVRSAAVTKRKVAKRKPYRLKFRGSYLTR